MKAKVFVLLAILALVNVIALPALGETRFVKALGGSSGDVGSSVIQTSGGDFVVTGGTYSFGAGDEDLLLANFDVNGDLIWAKAIGGNFKDYGVSVVQTSTGDFVVTGMTHSFGMGGDDLLLAKFDTDGNLIWASTFGGSSNDEGYSVIETSTGDYVVAGATESFGAGSWDFLLVDFTSSGRFRWALTLGGSDIEQAKQVVEDAGNLVITGKSRSFGAGNYDVLLAEFNSAGGLIWAKTLGGDNDDRAHSVTQITAGTFVVTGYTMSFGAGDMDLLLAEFNSAGELIWAKTLGGSSLDYGSTVTRTTDGGFVTTGWTQSFSASIEDLLLAKFGAAGTIEWAGILGGSSYDNGYSVTQTPVGGFMLTGGTHSWGAGNEDLLLVKFDADGRSCIGDSVSPIVGDVTPDTTTPQPTITHPDSTWWMSVQPDTNPFDPTRTTVCADEFIRGDYNGDGNSAEMSDPMAIFLWFSGSGAPPSCMDAADYNDDGSIVLADPLNQLNWIYEQPGGVPPPQPYPDCGPDPTADALDCAWHEYCMGGGKRLVSTLSQDTLTISRAAGPLGGNVVVPILGKLGENLDGYTACFKYDTLLLQVDSIGYVGTDVDSIEGGPFGFYPKIRESGKVSVGVPFDMMGQKEIPAGNRKLLNIFFSVKVTDPSYATDTTVIALVDSVGTPPKNNALLYGTEDIYPTLKNGTFYLYLPGDADRDGQEEMEDAYSSFGYLYEGKDSLVPVPEAIDANGDGYEDISDVMRIAYDMQGKGKKESKDPGHFTLAKGSSKTQDYGKLKVVCSGPRDPGDIMHVVIVAKAAQNYPVEAIGIAELLYPACLTPIAVTYYGKAADADTTGWSYETTESNDCNVSDRLSLGILFSVDGDSSKFLQPDEGEKSLAQIDFEINDEAPPGVYPISIPPEPPEIRPVFSVLYGSRHEPEVEIVDSVRVGIHPDGEGLPLPKTFSLSQNYPNPFNPLTQIKYALPNDCYVRLEVYNILGQKVVTLADGEEKAGYKIATWDAKDLASGIYFYRLKAGEFTAIKKMVLLK